MLHDRAVAVTSSADDSHFLRWIASFFYGDTLTAHATNRVLGELLVFYVLIIVGFGMLYLMWRANTSLSRARRVVGHTLASEKQRRYEPEDAKMYGMF